MNWKLPRHRAVALTLGAALAFALAPVQMAWAQSRSGEPVLLNFVGANIEAVARTMATISGRNVVVDPRVQGNINLLTERPVSPAAALNLFAATLRLQGFALVETAGLYKIVPEADAKLQGQVVRIDDGAAQPPSNQIVTQIFRLNHEAANHLVPILRPLISPNNTINVNPGNNSLVITDYAGNLQRLGRIISALDVAGATDVEVIALQYAVASDLAALLVRLIEPGAGGGAAAAADQSFRTTLLAEPRSNSLVLRAANPARLALVRSLVARLDRPSSEHMSGNIHVVYLKNANAVALAATLRAALAADTGAGAGAPAPGGGIARAGAAAASPATAPLTASAAPSTGGQIQADPATNALIISAPEPQFRQLRAVIDQLDSRRAQVFVESLIVEVNADKAAEIGLQWQLGGKDGNLIGLLGTNFGAGGANIFNLALQAGATPTLPPPGLNIGIARSNNDGPVLGVLARFLQQSGQANILSTPNLLTLDNEEARIVIGQNVPFITGQFTHPGARDGAVSPFQTIERKDVGLTLRVRPQISENGSIKMTVFQEVSSVQATSPDGPITNKRTIETTVLVDDGAIVVLGGLLQDEFQGQQDKVPGLGDLPLLGSLFRSENRNHNKTNLMVFLRPVVLRDSRATSSLTLDRYDIMRALQQDAQPQPSRLHGIDAAPVLPPPVPAPAQPAPAPTP